MTPTPRKGLPVWLWVLIGVFGLLFLAVTTVAVGGYYFMRQLVKNPRAMVQKFVEHDPNIEIVSDDGTGTITLKDKRKNKTFTINYEDARKGNIRIEGDNGEKFTVKTGPGGVEVTDKDSTTRIGTGSMRVPAWVPAYPASSPDMAAGTTENGEESGTFHFRTKDDAEKVTKYYEDTLKEAGFVVHNDSGALDAENAARKRSVNISVSGHTSVTVRFSGK